jgi:hypothetical protein
VPESWSANARTARGIASSFIVAPLSGRLHVIAGRRASAAWRTITAARYLIEAQVPFCTNFRALPEVNGRAALQVVPVRCTVVHASERRRSTLLAGPLLPPCLPLQ